MTGSSNAYRSFFKYGATLLASVLLLSVVLGTSASAHTRSNWRKQRNHIEERVRSQIGSPYRYGGTSSRGFDCSGLTMWVYGGHGASLPHSSKSQFALPQNDGRYKRVWKRSKLEVGDLVFHDTTTGRVGHVGIYIGGGKFISATSSSGVQVRSLYDSYWGPRWVGATRPPSIQRYR